MEADSQNPLNYYSGAKRIGGSGTALLEAVLGGEINPGGVFDLTIDLDDIAEGYAAMDGRRAIKVLVKVSALS